MFLANYFNITGGSFSQSNTFSKHLNRLKKNLKREAFWCDLQSLSPTWHQTLSSSPILPFCFYFHQQTGTLPAPAAWFPLGSLVFVERDYVKWIWNSLLPVLYYTPIHWLSSTINMILASVIISIRHFRKKKVFDKVNKVARSNVVEDCEDGWSMKSANFLHQRSWLLSVCTTGLVLSTAYTWLMY